MDETIRIYIAEDNAVILEKMKQFVAEYIDMHKLQGEIFAVSDNFECILDDISSHPSRVNVYFLDIILGESSNGLRLAQKIRGVDISGYIVFVTSHMEFAFPAIQYKVRALDYILKSDGETKQKIDQCLDMVMNEISGKRPRPEGQSVLIHTSGTNFIIPANEIIYFETNTVKRSIILHTQNKKIEFRDTLEELQSRLNDSFYRCHRSYLINLRHVQMISEKRNDLHVLLSDGTKCLVSPRYLRGLLKYGRNYA